MSGCVISNNSSPLGIAICGPVTFTNNLIFYNTVLSIYEPYLINLFGVTYAKNNLFCRNVIGAFVSSSLNGLFLHYSFYSLFNVTENIFSENRFTTLNSDSAYIVALLNYVDLDTFSDNILARNYIENGSLLHLNFMGSVLNNTFAGTVFDNNQDRAIVGGLPNISIFTTIISLVIPMMEQAYFIFLNPTFHRLTRISMLRTIGGEHPILQL
jgi:hypothetical protein